MCVTQDYKKLTLADKSVIRLALLQRQSGLEQLILDAASLKDVAYDRLTTQLKEERDQVKAAYAKVRP
jgi:hypothetical protein